jgi:hypothetical protein
MTIAAPVISAEMSDWVALGGGNSGIVGNSAHDYGFHVAADELPASDYSRQQDPNGPNGPFTNWDYACAGDFSHKNDESLRAKHRTVLARLMRGELPMICEFIGKPWADQPVYYWARWNGNSTLQRYTGSGHDHWSHISWYRSRADQRAYLWTPSSGSPNPAPPQTAWLRRPWPSYMPKDHYFGLITGPNESHGGYYAVEKIEVRLIQQRLIIMGFVPGVTDPNSSWADGLFEQPTKDAVTRWQQRDWASTTDRYGEVWYEDWYHMMTF